MFYIMLIKETYFNIINLFIYIYKRNVYYCQGENNTNININKSFTKKKNIINIILIIIIIIMNNIKTSINKHSIIFRKHTYLNSISIFNFILKQFFIIFNNSSSKKNFHINFV